MAPAPRVISRYEIVDRLGGGGMGVLYLARDPNIDRLVALKLLHSHFGPDMRERFAQEARAAGALAHPNIVTIHDYGEYEEAPFIVMEYVRGETLAELIKRRAPVPLLKKLRWMEELCAGLAYAHRSRIVHRDVKPLNLMIDHHGTLKILDFGIARFADAGLTQVSMQIGTPGYMSPEQIEGTRLDHRSDIFSSGAVFYELLSYRGAFPGETTHAIMNRALKDDPPPLREVCRGLDPAIEEVVRRALQKDPARRFQDIGQMRSAIEKVRVGLEPGYTEPTTVTPAPTPTPRPIRRTDPSELARRRAAELARNLETARRAFAFHDFDAAAEACERALVIDPAHAEALALLDQIQGSEGMTAVRTLLHSTRVALRDGSLTEAEELLRQAAEGDVEPAILATLREEIQARRAARQRGAITPFTGARAAVARARSCAEIGAIEAAVRYVNEALALDPNNADALKLRDDLHARELPLTPTYVESAEPVALNTPGNVHAGLQSRVRRLLTVGSLVIGVGGAAALGYVMLNPAERADAGAPAMAPTTDRTGTDDQGAGAETAPTPPPPLIPVRVGGDIPEPQKWRDVRPVHPPAARAKGVYGTVMLEITIAPNGRVVESQVVNSIPLLDQAAQDAVRQWQFEPTVVDGNAVPVVMTVAVPFARAESSARSESTSARTPAETVEPSRGGNEGDSALRRAQSAEAEGDLETALREFQSALSRNPGSSAAREGLARVGERTNRADRFVRQATTLFNAGDYDGATASVDRALDAYPRHARANELARTIQTAREAEQVRKKRPGQDL